MKIAIIGVTGFRNRGVEALVRPLVEQLLSRYPDAKISIATWSPDYDAARLSHPQVLYIEDAFLNCGCWVRDSDDRPSSLSRRALAKGLRYVNKSLRKRERREGVLTMPFKDPDLIIVSGGDLFSSDYGTDSLRHFVAPIEWAHRQGIPCAVIGQSVGRFKSDEDRQLWRKVEEMASLVTLREAHSLDYLKADLGSEPKRFHVTADTAFLLEPSETAERQLMPIGDRPCVAVSISESICKWTGESYQTHEEVWMTFIRHILNHWDANVVLIPHVQERFSDDRIIATRLLRQLDFDRRVRVLAEDLSAAEFKGIIAKCEMVIAERMHAAIAGLSSGVCTVPIGYSIKAEGIVSSVFAGSGLNSDELWLPLGDFLNFGRSEHILDEIWRQRNQVKKAALACLPRVKSEAMRNFDLIERELR